MLKSVDIDAYITNNTHMTLKEWIKKEGRGAVTRLHYDARIAVNTIKKAIRGEPVSLPIAKEIHKATGEQVSIYPLLNPDQD